MKDKNENDFWIFSLNDPICYHSRFIHDTEFSLYYLIWIQEVNPLLSSELKEVLHIKPDSILLIDSYLVPVFLNMDLKGKLIVFSEAFCKTKENTNLLKLVFFHNNWDGVIAVDSFNENQRKCLNLIEKEYYANKDKLHSTILLNLLINFLLLATHYTYYDEQLVQSHYIDYAVQFEEMVNSLSLKEKTVAYYAQKMGITEKTLSKSLQLIFNLSPKTIIRNRIIFESIRLLLFTESNITQIAHKTGFDVSYFIKFFFQNTGMQPRAFREKFVELLRISHV
jgi:AraC-like DNA-binding protein